MQTGKDIAVEERAGGVVWITIKRCARLLGHGQLVGSARAMRMMSRAAVTRQPEGAWRAPILLTSASQPASIRALSEAIDRHQAWRGADPHRYQQLRAQRARYRLKRLLEIRVAEAIAVQADDFFDAPLQQQLATVLTATRTALDL